MLRLLTLALSFLFVQPVFAAIDTDGSNDYIDCGNVLHPSGSGTAFSISAWINPDVSPGTSSQDAVLGKRSGWGANTDYYSFEFGQWSPNDRYMTFDFWGTGGVGRGSTSNTQLTLNEWAQVGVTYDGSTVTHYLNGSADGTKAISDALNTGGNSIPFQIGKANSFYFNGTIDEVYIWTNTVINAHQMKILGKSKVKGIGLQFSPDAYFYLDDYPDGDGVSGNTFVNLPNRHVCTANGGASIISVANENLSYP
ncbi:MAG: hypothetical protein DRJ03_03485 [Chloroflexi bacterium]|nr:MAG: hypothetical protein DRJ03_03485 [Chloroflexota bacterium]